MKSVIFGLIVFSGLGLIQCKSETEKDDDAIVKNVSEGFTKITGYIHNREVYPDTKEITVNVSHISGQDRVSQIKTPIRDDGTFSFEIDLIHAQDVTMHPHLDFLYLIPGDSIHVEIDFKDFSNIRLSGGKSVEINHDFFKYFDETGYRTTGNSYKGVGTDCEKNCSWAEIREKMDEERDYYRERRQAFLQKTRVSEEVMNLTEAMIELDYYNRFVGSFWRRENSYGRETMNKAALMNELNEVIDKYFKPGFYSNAHFNFIASAYMPAAGFFQQPNTDINLAEWIKETAKTEIIKDFMLTVQAGNSLLRKDLDDFEQYSKLVSNEYLLERLMQEYRFTRTKMAYPEDISSYILGNSKDFTSSVSFKDSNVLAKRISPNKGKVQVINLAATWCPPCKEVLEQLALLRNEYADKDVSFAFICLSPDTPETRKMYQEKGIDDTSVYFLSNEEYHFFLQTFAPVSVPYGILVNRKGVIVDYGTHVRPQIKLREKINLLLKQDNLIK